MKILRNEMGMSIVSVMVAIGLTGILATILMNLSEQQSKQTRKAQLDTDMTDMVNQIQTIFTRGQSCTATFIKKKKGDLITRLRVDDDEEKPDFASVQGDEPFRGTKLFLTGMKIITDEELKNQFNKEPEPGVIVIDVEFQRPKSMPGMSLGADTIRKQFDIRVNYGEVMMVSGDGLDESTVVEACIDKFGPTAFIVDLETYDRAEPQEKGVEANMGMCFHPDKPSNNNPNSYVINCITAK